MAVGEPLIRLTPELVPAEVRDTIDQLDGRPDSTDRRLAAVDAFLADRTEENRAAARAGPPSGTRTPCTPPGTGRPAPPRRDGWEQARTAVTTALLRAKYTQYPAIARILLDTHDATLVHDDSDSGYRGDNGGRGRNRTGRLLELVRSELRAEQAGITLPEPGTTTG